MSSDILSSDGYVFLFSDTCADTCCDENKQADGEVVVRTRSVSMLRVTKKDSDTQPLESPRVMKELANDVAANLNNIQEEVQSRLVTFQISKMFLMLFSVDSKTMLLEKKINNISFCTKVKFNIVQFNKCRFVFILFITQLS